MVNRLERRLEKLEDAVSKHLLESGRIQAKLDWNTWLTGAIAVAIVTKAIADLFK